MAGRDISRFFEFGKKIIAIGRNYSAHAKELGNEVPTKPFFFLKPTSSYVPYEKQVVTVEIPHGCNNVHHEVELGVVIGKGGRDINEENAFDYVSGYCVALDMTSRELQTEARNAGLPWSASKGYDTFCPIGGYVDKSAISDPHNVHLRMKVNGEVKQNGCSNLMTFQIPALISHVSRVMTLEEGDLILTGTPAGVGPVVEGDSFVAELSASECYSDILSSIEGTVVQRK